MDHLDTTNPEQRTVDKFYTRLRMHLDDIEPLPSETKKPVTAKLKNLKEDEKYGKVGLEELKKILENYDEKSDRPTKCDRLLAGSFAKLLYSKRGFHHPSSTDYLVENLNIKEHNRDTFLGGHSTYAMPEANSLKGINKHHTSMYIKNRARELLDILDNRSVSLPENFDDDVKELMTKDPRDGNSLAVRGKLYMRKKKPYQAVDDLKKALESSCDYQEGVRLDLGEAYFRIGSIHYSAEAYDKANMSFLESLVYDPNHAGSKLHSGLCISKIKEKHRHFGEHNRFLTRRK